MFQREVISTFALCGLVSGTVTSAFLRELATVRSPQPGLPLPWIIDGGLFFLALLVAGGACRAAGWLATSASPKRFTLAGALVLGVPFVGLVTGILAGFSSVMILEECLAHAAQTTQHFALALSLVLGVNVGTACAAACVLQATRMFGAGAGRTGLIVFALAAALLGTVTSVVLLTSLHQDPADARVLIVLHLMGEPLYAASAGYCLSRAPSDDPSPTHHPAR